MTDGTFVYDDDCGFCTWWADYLAGRTDLEMVGFSELTDEHLERLPHDYEECAHLLTDDAVYSCGAAVERGLASADLPPGSADLFGFLRQFRDYERVRERAYHALAEKRGLWGQFLSKDAIEE
jgi:predicted DCC family thiol-disulfide oxidoreductase YuxK